MPDDLLRKPGHESQIRVVRAERIGDSHKALLSPYFTWEPM